MCKQFSQFLRFVSNKTKGFHYLKRVLFLPGQYFLYCLEYGIYICYQYLLYNYLNLANFCFVLGANSSKVEIRYVHARSTLARTHACTHVRMHACMHANATWEGGQCAWQKNKINPGIIREKYILPPPLTSAYVNMFK